MLRSRVRSSRCRLRQHHALTFLSTTTIHSAAFLAQQSSVLLTALETLKQFIYALLLNGFPPLLHSVRLCVDSIATKRRFILPEYEALKPVIIDINGLDNAESNQKNAVINVANRFQADLLFSVSNPVHLKPFIKSRSCAFPDSSSPAI